MVTPESIQAGIAQGINAEHLSVAGDGRHFEAVVVAPQFAGKRAIARHQLVYATLGHAVGREIHALSIDAQTPEEWAARGGKG